MARMIIGFLIVSLLGSCASTRMMTQQGEYARTLKQLVNAPIDIEEKLDGVAMVFDQVLQESMDYGSDRNTLKHINRFTKRNKETMNVLYSQIEEEMSTMNAAQKIQFSIQILRKPYIKSFVAIVPKVERKINRKLRQINMFGKFLKILNPF
jgi:lipopolysaccharide biosynthesis regulator YciM